MVNEQDFYRLALQVHGIDHQQLQCVEEMAELTKELIKNTNRRFDNLDAIIEEIADVEIMLAQLKMHYNIETEVAESKQKKFIRVMPYLQQEKAAG